VTRAGAMQPGGSAQPNGQAHAKANNAGSFAWLITDFVHRVPGAAHAVVVSADGLLAGGKDLVVVGYHVVGR
jgi:hypothetical protein